MLVTISLKQANTLSIFTNVQDGKMVGIGGTSTTVPVQNATRHNLPALGSYTFTARSGIKTQPLVANPDV